MKFGTFYQLQLPRPWAEGDVQRLFGEALEQIELADKLGFDYAWEVEHHFLEEYSFSSAPEVFLAACSQRTKNIRLGHGIRLMAPPYNNTPRVAECLATLDLISNGRVEWGTGESASPSELGGFNIPLEEKNAMWREAVEQCANMLVMDPYPGFQGKYVSMPCRNVIPKPVQRPHPPLWLACSRPDHIKIAARNGMGALTFTFIDPADSKIWVDEYYRTFKEECVPIGHAVNPNIAMVTGFGLHENADEARRRSLPGLNFFTYGLHHFFLGGQHIPSRTNLWEAFTRPHVGSDGVSVDARENVADGRGIGTPEQIRAHMRGFHGTGVDQVVLIQQCGRTQHAHICESLELFARDVMPEFKAHEEEWQLRKAEELAPYIEAAMKRKKYMRPLMDSEIPPIAALGRKVVAEAAE